MNKLSSEIGIKHPLRILIAEDNPSNLRVAVIMLKKIGYQTDTAYNGIEVLEKVKTNFYDLIFMDIQMPQMDGITAAIEIKKMLPPEKMPRIIAVTANSMKEDHEKYIAAGLDDCIVKPFRAEDLIEALMNTNPIPA